MYLLIYICIVYVCTYKIVRIFRDCRDSPEKERKRKDVRKEYKIDNKNL